MNTERRVSSGNRGNYSVDLNYDNLHFTNNVEKGSFTQKQNLKNKNITVKQKQFDSRVKRSNEDKVETKLLQNVKDKLAFYKGGENQAIRIIDNRHSTNPDKENKMKQATIVNTIQPQFTNSPQMKKNDDDDKKSSESPNSGNSSTNPSEDLGDLRLEKTKVSSTHSSVRVSERKDNGVALIHEVNKNNSNRFSLPPESTKSSFAMKRENLTKMINGEKISITSGDDSQVTSQSLIFMKKVEGNKTTGDKTEEKAIKPFDLGTFNSPKKTLEGKFSPDNMKGSLIIHKKNFMKKNIENLSNEKIKESISVKNQDSNTLNVNTTEDDRRKSIMIPTPSNSNKKGKKEEKINLKSCMKKKSQNQLIQSKKVKFNERVQTSENRYVPLNDMYPRMPKFQNHPGMTPFPTQNMQYRADLDYRNNPQNQQIQRPLRFVGDNNPENSGFRGMNRATLRQIDGHPRMSPMLFDSMTSQELNGDNSNGIKRVSVVQKTQNMPGNPPQNKLQSVNGGQKIHQVLENNGFNPPQNQIIKSPHPEIVLIQNPGSNGNTPPTPKNIINLKQGVSQPILQHQNKLINPNINIQNLNLQAVQIPRKQKSESLIITPRNNLDNRIGSPGKTFKKIEALHKKNMNNKIHKILSNQNKSKQKKIMTSPKLKKLNGAIQNQMNSSIISNKNAGTLFINSPNAANLMIQEQLERRESLKNNIPLRETRPNMKHSFLSQQNPPERDRVNSPDPSHIIRQNLINQKNQVQAPQLINMNSQIFKTTDQVNKNSNMFNSFVHPQQQDKRAHSPKPHFASFVHQPPPFQQQPNSNRNIANDKMRMSLQQSFHSGNGDNVFNQPKFSLRAETQNEIKPRRKDRKNPLSHNFRSPRPNFAAKNVNQAQKISQFNLDKARRRQSERRGSRGGEDIMRFNSAPRNPISGGVYGGEGKRAMTPTKLQGGSMRPRFADISQSDADFGSFASARHNRAFGGPGRINEEKDEKCSLI